MNLVQVLESRQLFTAMASLVIVGEGERDINNTMIVNVTQEMVIISRNNVSEQIPRPRGKVNLDLRVGDADMGPRKNGRHLIEINIDRGVKFVRQIKVTGTDNSVSVIRVFNTSVPVTINAGDESHNTIFFNSDRKRGRVEVNGGNKSTNIISVNNARSMIRCGHEADNKVSLGSGRHKVLGGTNSSNAYFSADQQGRGSITAGLQSSNLFSALGKRSNYKTVGPVEYLG